MSGNISHACMVMTKTWLRFQIDSMINVFHLCGKIMAKNIKRLHETSTTTYYVSIFTLVNNPKHDNCSTLVSSIATVRHLIMKKCSCCVSCFSVTTSNEAIKHTHKKRVIKKNKTISTVIRETRTKRRS